MGEFLQSASIKDRALAGLVDLGVPILLFWLLTKVNFILPGAILSSLYILFRDSSSGKSLGKRWRKLCAINLSNRSPCTWKESFYRNLFISVPVLGLPMMAIEAGFALFRDPDLRRIGDHFARTMVIREISLEPEKTDD